MNPRFVIRKTLVSFRITFSTFHNAFICLDAEDAIPKLAENKPADVGAGDLFPPVGETEPLLVGVTRNIKHLPFKHTTEVKVTNLTFNIRC